MAWLSQRHCARCCSKDGCLTLPGVYDGISARVAASLGFDALYMTGYGVVASALGVADAGTATFTEMLDRVRCIAGAISVPFIADGDTGYGGLLNVDRTVRGYAAAGASGIQLEDQEFPKKCGHTEFRRVIPADDAVAKIRVAVDARPSRDFLIVARTDARYAEGMDAALRRAEGFLDAGADVLFVESPESLEELRRVAETFKGATLLANMVEGGRTPYLSTSELATMGFKIALYPASGFLTAAGALQLRLSQPENRRNRHGQRSSHVVVRRHEQLDGLSRGACLRKAPRPGRQPQGVAASHRKPFRSGNPEDGSDRRRKTSWQREKRSRELALSWVSPLRSPPGRRRPHGPRPSPSPIGAGNSTACPMRSPWTRASSRRTASMSRAS